MANRINLLLIAVLLATLVPAFAQAADQPAASATIPPPAMPPAPYIAPSHRGATPPPIPKASALKHASPVAEKKVDAQHQRHSRQIWARRFRHQPPREPHRAVARIDRQVPAPVAPPPLPRRHYAGDVPPSQWEEAPPPAWYEYYPAPPWRRGPMPW